MTLKSKRKTLKNLIKVLPEVKLENLKDEEITAIAADSRKVKKGNLFVAIRGQNFDGHNFIPEAISKGAVAVVGERGVSECQSVKVSKYQSVKVSKCQSIRNYTQVKNSRKALGLLTSAWYDFPSKKLKVIGVTGTDGKTTTVGLIYSILKAAGKKVGRISTIDAKIGRKIYETGLHTTTPDPLKLWEFLNLMVRKGCEYAVLEVTSHGLDQERVAGINFKIGVLTNVTHEHLDYHKTFENYLATKAKLLRRAKVAIVNKDDPSYDQILNLNPPSASGGAGQTSNFLTYGIKSEVDIRANDIKMTAGGMSFFVNSNLIRTLLVGEYNVYNILAAVAAAKALGIGWEAIKTGIKSFKPPCGRFEVIDEGQDFRVIIDFAHTPNALKNLLTAVRRLVAKLPNSQTARLITVFGCTGERDREKRPIMGEIAAKLADFVILTSEDSYMEDSLKIIAEIEKGVRKGGKALNRDFWKVPDRKEAIEFAISLAKGDNIVLITGMGHEETINIGGKETPWSDREVAREALKKRR